MFFRADEEDAQHKLPKDLIPPMIPYPQEDLDYPQLWAWASGAVMVFYSHLRAKGELNVAEGIKEYPENFYQLQEENQKAFIYHTMLYVQKKHNSHHSNHSRQ